VASTIATPEQLQKTKKSLKREAATGQGSERRKDYGKKKEKRVVTALLRRTFRKEGGRLVETERA